MLNSPVHYPEECCTEENSHDHEQVGLHERIFSRSQIRYCTKSVFIKNVSKSVDNGAVPKINASTLYLLSNQFDPRTSNPDLGRRRVQKSINMSL